MNHVHLHQTALEEEISNFFDILFFSYVQRWAKEKKLKSYSAVQNVFKTICEVLHK